MSEWRDRLDSRDRDLLERSEHPRWISPMLATLTDDYFSDPNWIFEPKYDGERVLAFRDGEKVRILSRNRKQLNDTYPELADALSHLGQSDFVVDGEVVAFENGVSSFARLQKRMQIADSSEARASKVAVYLYVFDLPYFDGYRLDALPLRRRKVILRDALDFGRDIRYTRHRNSDGEAFYREACRKGWEGIIAKRADAPYRHSRSKDWLKFKCGQGQELVIGGFTEPQGERLGFGALLVGYYEDDKLRYAGKVGTGYDDDFLARFRKQLDANQRKTSPFSGPVDEKNVHWVTPKLVGEFGFTEWTDDGKLRHPRFLGMRHDKQASDVVRETPDA